MLSLPGRDIHLRLKHFRGRSWSEVFSHATQLLPDGVVFADNNFTFISIVYITLALGDIPD